MLSTGRTAMPTAARLAGAIAFGLWGWYIAGLAAVFYVEGRPPAVFVPVCILSGLWLGWAYVGRRVGQGYILSIGHGLTAGFAFCVMVLFVVAFATMIRQAMRLRYSGPMEAAVDVFAQMENEASRFIDTPLIASVFLGAVLCGWVTEFVGRRYS